MSDPGSQQGPGHLNPCGHSSPVQVTLLYRAGWVYSPGPTQHGVVRAFCRENVSSPLFYWCSLMNSNNNSY